MIYSPTKLKQLRNLCMSMTKAIEKLKNLKLVNKDDT